MKVSKEAGEYLINSYKGLLAISLLYLLGDLSHMNSGNISTTLVNAIQNYIKIFLFPITIYTVTIVQFATVFANKEIARKKNIIDLEDKTTKELIEVKELLEGIVITTTNSYKTLLINMRVKDKSIEEKLLDKMEGKRFKYMLNYDNEELEYIKQITKMNKIIYRGLEVISSFTLEEEKILNLDEEDINNLKNNSKKINDYFLNYYNKTPLPEKLPTAENRSSRTRKQQENKNLTWSDVQNAAKEMIIVIDKI